MAKRMIGHSIYLLLKHLLLVAVRGKMLGSWPSSETIHPPHRSLPCSQRARGLTAQCQYWCLTRGGYFSFHIRLLVEPPCVPSPYPTPLALPLSKTEQERELR